MTAPHFAKLIRAFLSMNARATRVIGHTKSSNFIIFRTFFSLSFSCSPNVNPIRNSRSNLTSLFPTTGEQHARSIDQVAAARPPNRIQRSGSPIRATHTGRSPDRL